MSWRFKGRDDADHVWAQLPGVGGPENADPALIAMVERWAPTDELGPRGGLVLMGPSQAGKTTAAVHLVKRCLERYGWATSIAFILASDLADSNELMAKAMRVDLLVLDDLGKENDKWKRLFRVLDHRHTRRPTIVTTGLNAEQIEATYDGAFVRRLFEYKGRKVETVSTFKGATG